jgi:hypothetical protein
MSNLDNFHPFRQSVNVRDGSSSNNQAPNESPSNKENQEKEFTPFFSWKTKLRLFIFGMAGSLLLYVLSSALDSFSFTSDSKSSTKTGEAQPIPDQIFDKNDLNERGREVSHARSKAGIFAAIFCKGGKRSRFCED